MPQNHKKKKHHKRNHVPIEESRPNWIIPRESSSLDEASSCCSEAGYSDSTASEGTGNSPPYAVEHSPVMGRYLVATRTIRPGEIIINDFPLVIGPTTEADYTCVGCYVPLSADQEFKCKGCGWTLCGPKCVGLKAKFGHSPEECSILRENRVADLFDEANAKERGYMYETIFPLRCLLLKENDKEGWNRLCTLEHHNPLRKNIPSLWGRNQSVVVDRIRNQWKIKQFSEEEIHTVCGFIEVNCFEVGQNGAKARALYIKPSLLAHDCRSNTTHTDHPISHELYIRATRPIKKGETITLSYAYLLQGTLKRRDHLREGKFFWCQCERCTDPTEFQTFTSALRCPKCKDGIILSRDPLDQDAIWSCTRCTYHLTGKIIDVLMDRIYGELDALDIHDVDGLEEFLDKYRNVLHKNHYLCLSAKHSLCQLYGRYEGYLIQELSVDKLKTKEDYCRDLLKVVDRLEPGVSRLRGVIMYELHAPIMIQATRLFEKKQINVIEFKRRLREVIALLKDAERILSIEPEGSPEYTMALASTDALKRIGPV